MSTNPLDILQALLCSVWLPGSTEEQFQNAVERVLTNKEIPHKREYVAAPGERIDFYLTRSHIAVELKLWTNAAAALRQLKRYADLPQVFAVVLVSRRPIDLPATLSGKPVRLIALWKTALA
jgi:hypothetical protein